VDSELARIWFQRCKSNRGLLHAFLFSQLARNRGAQGRKRPRGSPELVYCHTETLQYVNEKFSQPTTACDDDNVLAVAALAYNGPARTETVSRSPCQGPLKALQVLDIYGGLLDVVPMHLQGLRRMLSMRGGLANLELPGLAQQMS